MSETDRLFSIGGLSKLTGVHVRCLRYYEQLGILHPAHVDASSGYRYYTFFHMRIVEAIQYCVELDIPLKEFHRFLLEENGQIDYASLVAYGQKVTEEKLKRIQYHRQFLESLQQEMTHAQDYGKTSVSTRTLPERYCYCLPYSGVQKGPAFHSAMYKLLSHVEKSGLKAGYDNGMLLLERNGVRQTFLFINIRDTRQDLSRHPEIIKIPGGEYLCTVSDESRILQSPEIFATYFKSSSEKLIVEVELLTEKYHYLKPTFELRCYLQ